MEEGFVWKTRDAAEELLQERRQMASDSNSSNTTNKTNNKPPTQKITATTPSMLVRNSFDIDGLMGRLAHSHKGTIIPQAFHTAASCVLRALRNKTEPGNTSTKKTSGSEQDTTNADALPAVFADWKRLEDSRRNSLDRSHNNKDYSKKKKVDGLLDSDDLQTSVHSIPPPTSSSKSEMIVSNRSSSSTKKPSSNKSINSAPGASSSSSQNQPQKVPSGSATKSSSSTSGGGAAASASSSAAAAPKFTRNTPASSAAALDFRFNSSRAILCAAANLVFESLTPPFSVLTKQHLDALSVPQNPANKIQQQTSSGSKKAGSATAGSGNVSAASGGGGGGGILSQQVVNMGAVVVEAQLLSQRTIGVVENAVRRSNLRYLFRKTNAQFLEQKHKNKLLLLSTSSCHSRPPQQQLEEEDNDDDMYYLSIPNPYKVGKDEETSSSSSSSSDEDHMSEDDDNDDDELGTPSYNPNPDACTVTWTTQCLPRLLRILAKGAGHAIVHDYHWKTRHGRVANLLHNLDSFAANAVSAPQQQTQKQHQHHKYGPHLIVTIEPEVDLFSREFETGTIRPLVMHVPSATTPLRVLTYRGSPGRRSNLRTRFFSQGKGLATSPWHVLVTSYSNFLQDFLHFSQVPFDSVILDDGVLWMAAAQGDPNSALGSIWENIFAKNDQQIGLAGTGLIDNTNCNNHNNNHWDYSLIEVPESLVKDGWVGLTCRHRILTSSAMSIEQSRGSEKVPVSGLLSFLAPHFADIVREEWDRSRIASDADSTAHFRGLVARGTVAHYNNNNNSYYYAESSSSSSTTYDGKQQESQAVAALNGKLDSRERSDPMIPEMVYDDAFVSDGKINFSRRSCLAWLGRSEKSWLRYELGKAKLQHVLDAMKISNRHGHICEEITTASSTTSSGATGQVAGTMAYRLAIRCGRHFGSEQGLRQHVSALHAPPGTWLCRTCGSDCITSQARTHHERSCGAPTAGGGGGVGGEQNNPVGATPTVGQGSTGKSGVGKKKAGRSAASQQASGAEEKDADGSFRVPGYRGVWVNQVGKHFVKVDGKILNKEGSSDERLLFDNIDDAARKHDELLKKKENKKGKLELNFKPDGSRVVYDDITAASTSGLGGSATSVVPALSIINIKDLPPDVKPLLRDPRQTSRTGGNSKRHVYAYRGVCRQARKGHDRWQSQISFMGVNHYLGTFDSEWDAAAIYAWAHLILYGEEATKQAQKEGEEAAAAYEREQQDIAAGKVPETSPRPKKIKKPPTTKKPGESTVAAAPLELTGGGGVPTSSSTTSTKHHHESTSTAPNPKKRKSSVKDSGVGGGGGAAPEKKAKTNTKACKLEKEAIGSTVAKGVTKASVIAPKDLFEDMTDEELLRLAAVKIRAVRKCEYCVSELRFSLPTVEPWFRPCIPVTSNIKPLGGALLLGLNPALFGWDLQDFVASQDDFLQHDMMTAIQLLAVEYDEDGVNEKFACVMQGTVCIMGRASETMQQAYKNLGLGSLPMGGSVGKLDCHIGGVPGSCGESAACIRYAPTEESDFYFSCLSDDDVVTVNGERITVAQGSVPLFDEDVCSVGARVFVFLPPSDKK